MNILLVSECDKRALTETRRILDQFAERRGERTWQTPITQAGLDALRRLLRNTARKNTAVACHWIRGLDHSELLWIVGDARRFNAEGAVPTNTTARNVLRGRDENDWHSAEDIRLLAQLAALLHDLGKASLAFQRRLRGQLQEKNLYRHEWVSLRLFQAFVGDDDDAGWLARLAAGEYDESAWIAQGRYLRDGLDVGIERHPFRPLQARAPLAAAVAWLIVTHHRLPVIPAWKEDGTQALLGRRASGFKQAWLTTPLAEVAHDWNEMRPAPDADAKPYWELAGELPVIAPAWRTQAARLARRLVALRGRRDGDWLGNTYVMHLARLCLMLADHHYSSLGVDKTGQPVAARRGFVRGGQTLFANTARNRHGERIANQSLLEHLLGVAHSAGLIAHALPGFERHLPRLAQHRGLRRRSADPRFSWQDKAFDAATSLREQAAEHGAFVVNMASTGCGKTLANARILYALADPQLGLRASYALGLRTLTLQTGRSYRHDLHLGEDELAVLVGGSASRALFEFHQRQAEAGGSASVQSLLEEDSRVLYDGNVADHPLLSRALTDADIRKLLSAPMLVCTVDHLAPATEALRAGRQIAPMLRLMSADLVLDELDDYDLDDLPALTRLVHWAGMLGTRVVLSSATLPPALVEGMFVAYQAGRRLHRRNRGADGGRDEALVEVPCLWTDEFGVHVQTCPDDATFAAGHRSFVDKRVRRLEQAEPLRLAEVIPLPIVAQQRERIRSDFATHLLSACQRLHADHANIDPVSGKRVSFGIVRMANIDRLIDVASALYAQGAPEGMRIHLCAYHARFPLVQRSAIEQMLDTAFNRRDQDAVWRMPTVRDALDSHPASDHLFVVLASPVCEVGRDWDADWAVVEPSSMRSLIQLAGRVQRHRRIAPRTANVLVFDTNLKALESPGSGRPAFCLPGFEKRTADERFLLASHRLTDVLRAQDFRRVDAIARIRPRAEADWRPRHDLVDLEQARIAASMRPYLAPAPSGSSRRAPPPSPESEADHAPLAWRYPQAALTGMLPQQQPFRNDREPKVTLVFLPGGEEDEWIPHRVEDALERSGQSPHVPARELLHEIALDPAPGIAVWGGFELSELLTEQAEALDRPLTAIAPAYSMLQLPPSAQGWRWHRWLGFTRRR